MDHAIPINPYDQEDFAWKIKSALELPAEERKRRMRAMRNSLRVNNIFRWIGTNLQAMDQIGSPTRRQSPPLPRFPAGARGSVPGTANDLPAAGPPKAG